MITTTHNNRRVSVITRIRCISPSTIQQLFPLATATIAFLLTQLLLRINITPTEAFLVTPLQNHPLLQQLQHQQQRVVVSTNRQHVRTDTSHVFIPQRQQQHRTTKNTVYSSIANVAIKPESIETIEGKNDIIKNDQEQSPTSRTTTGYTILTSDEVKLRIDKQLERLKLKDRMSPNLSKEKLDIVYEDDHLMIANKPSGVLTVSGKDKSNNSFVQAIYDQHKNTSNIQFKYADHMVVHRLGMDISGLLILAKNVDTVRKLNTSFRTRDVERTYEVLVCGHVTKNKGRITLPIMRDYEHPLYIRISTDQHQEALVDLDPDIVGKKLLEQPKESTTEYKVLSREELNGQPVTRLLVRAVSGRMHQLNCHLAAIGHPIVGDMAYGGINGMAASNGGLTDDELEYMIPKAFSPSGNNRATVDQQLRTIADRNETHTACHAKTLRFRHPITKKFVTFESDTPF